MLGLVSILIFLVLLEACCFSKEVFCLNKKVGGLTLIVLRLLVLCIFVFYAHFSPATVSARTLDELNCTLVAMSQEMSIVIESAQALEEREGT